MMNISAARIAIAMVVAVLAPATASAGVYADDLGKCLVKATSVGDKATFTTWMFGVMSLNPAVHDLSKITPAQLNENDHKVAELFGRLVFKDCRTETLEAIKYEWDRLLSIQFRASWKSRDDELDERSASLGRG